MKIKVSEATEQQLDWLVSSIELDPIWDTTPMPESYTCGCGIYVHPSRRNLKAIHIDDCCYNYHFTTDWAQGGPIIEREKIDIEYHKQWQGDGLPYWKAMHIKNEGGLIRYYGLAPTPLIAAMRCYCCAVLGDEVEVPGELK